MGAGEFHPFPEGMRSIRAELNKVIDQLRLVQHRWVALGDGGISCLRLGVARVWIVPQPVSVVYQ